jgi:hypothetical protein
MTGDKKMEEQKKMMVTVRVTDNDDLLRVISDTLPPDDGDTDTALVHPATFERLVKQLRSRDLCVERIARFCLADDRLALTGIQVANVLVVADDKCEEDRVHLLQEADVPGITRLAVPYQG